MNQAALIVLAALLLTIFSTTPSFADPEVRGEVREMNGNRIVLELPAGGTRRFELTRETRMFSQGMPVQIKHILPHSLVRISVKDGRASGIFLEGVPK